MIESPKNFIEQFQNFIEHIAGLMKTFLTKEVADNYYLGKSDNAVSATKATQDASGNVITSTYATKTEVTSGLSGKLGKTEKASSASTADAVAWTGVSGKPSFATVATSGSYNDLKNKPSIPSSVRPKVVANCVLFTVATNTYTVPRNGIVYMKTYSEYDSGSYYNECISVNNYRVFFADTPRWYQRTVVFPVTAGDTIRAYMERNGSTYDTDWSWEGILVPSF